MEFLNSLFENKLASLISAAVIGGIVTQVFRARSSRRGVVRYTVVHYPLGVTAEEPGFGKVQVMLNGETLANLFSSRVTVENVSSQDFENVEVRIYTNPQFVWLLTEQMAYENSTHIVHHTEEFKKLMAIPEGQKPTQQQWDTYHGRRHYLLPVLNRRQRVNFNILTTVALNQPDPTPLVFCDILHKGLKVKWTPGPRSMSSTIMGVPLGTVLLVGNLLMLGWLVGVMVWVDRVWVAALLIWLFAALLLQISALIVRVWWKIHAWCYD